MAVAIEKKRKTIKVREIVSIINRMLAQAILSQDAKSTLCTMAEEVLMSTGHYNGFNYLKWCNNGCEAWHADGEPEDKTPYLGQEYDRFYYNYG